MLCTRCNKSIVERVTICGLKSTILCHECGTKWDLQVIENPICVELVEVIDKLTVLSLGQTSRPTDKVTEEMLELCKQKRNLMRQIEKQCIEFILGKNALIDIQKERTRQIEKGYTAKYDDTKDESFWPQLVRDQVLKGLPTRQILIRMAALAIAGIESIERKSKCS